MPREILTRVLIGTDHQRIAKLDRENEVAPPAKIAPSVGRVCSLIFYCIPLGSEQERIVRLCKMLVLR